MLQAWANTLVRCRRWGIPALVLLWLCGGLYLFRDKRPLPWMKTGGASQSESARVHNELRDHFGLRQENSLGLVLEREHPALPELEQKLEKFKHLRGMTRIPSHQPHRNPLFYLQLDPQLPLSEAEAQVPKVRDIIKPWSEKHKVRFWVTGQQAFFYDMGLASQSDANRAERWGLLLACLVLIFCFGSLTAAALPLLIGASTLLGTQVLLRLFWIGSDQTALILNSMVGLGLSIDYSLFMLSRYREERAAKDIAPALATVLRQTGRTVLYSAAVMFCALLSLLIPEVETLRGTVWNLLLVVGLSALNALTLLPLLLVALDGVLDRPRWLARRILAWHSEARWRRLALAVTAHPLRWCAVSLLLIALMAWPVKSLRLWEPMQSLAPPGTESVEGFEVLSQDGWGGEVLPIQVLVYAPADKSLLDDQQLKALYAFVAALEARPEVASVTGLVSSRQPFENYRNLYGQYRAMQATGLVQPLPLLKATPTGEVTLINVHQRNMMRIEQAYPILDWIKNYRETHPDLKMIAGGVVARAHSFTTEMYRHAPLMITLVMLGILLLLSFYLRSLVLPVKAGIMNFLPILSGFGLLVWACQQGGLGPLLPHFEPRPGITNIVPLTLFCIVFGLSMDYEVLILSRIDEAWRDTGDVREAVVSGLSRSSGIITGAALILMGVFAPGIFSSSQVVQEISFGISVTILIDATLVRLLLVPSLMMLMGKWNWWHPWK